ncbi:MAG: polymer-forming cytoskeletal protein [Gammaproteobacteria bacterium]|nr:polymer-forming cytoskeletal protein [Gammaproteobacteria bacterium]
MAIFNPSTQKKDAGQFASEPAQPARREERPAVADFNPTSGPPQQQPRASAPAAKESLIAANLTIEGKIEGTGHVRIAGQFKGDVNVKGDLTIERGARLNGGVRAEKVTVAGDLEGNIESAERVELLDSAVLNGDLKAGTLTVAAGSRIRGHIECGWDDGDERAPAKGGKQEAKADAKAETATAS